MKTESLETPALPVAGSETSRESVSGPHEIALLSLQQKRLWSARAGYASCFSQFLGRIEGRLDSCFLRACFCRVARKYEILHTSFYQGQTGPGAKLAPLPEGMTWTESDLRGLSAAEQAGRVEGCCRLAGTDYDRDSGVFEAALITLADDDHCILLRVPAICCDSLSLENLWNEVAWCYAHTAEPVDEEVLQYSDYARWQQDLFSAQESQGISVPWLEPPPEHRGDMSPSASSTAHRDGMYAGRRLEFLVPERIVHQLENAAGSARVSMEATFLSCWLSFLSAYRNSSKLDVAVSIDGRPMELLKNAVGLFELYVPLTISIQGSETASSLFEAVQSVLAAASRSQHGVNWGDPDIGGAKTQSLEFGFSWADCSGARSEAGVRFSSYSRHSQIECFDLALHGCRSERVLRCALEYDSSRIQAAVISQLQQGFIALLEEIVADPRRLVDKLESIARTRHRILAKWNETTHDYPAHRGLHELFEEQAEKTPYAIAVRQREICMSYEELNGRANQVAHGLRQLGVRPETLVGICLNRSPEMVIGVLGILKAGGAYVPIDPRLPRTRIAFLLQDTGAAILVTNGQSMESLPAETCLIVSLDGSKSSLSVQETRNPRNWSTPQNAAYVLYTSGSTGDPKGVVVPHAAIVNYLHWCRHAYAVQDGQGAPVQSSLSFDLTLTSLFGPLLAGRTVVLLDEEDALDGLVAAMSPDADFSLLKITPAHLAILNHRLALHAYSRAPARVVVVGGEPLNAETVSQWREKFPATNLVNEYGPTETVVGCCVHFIGEGQQVSGTVPIGRPIANTSLYVLDGRGQPIVDDTPGELYVGGAGVARAYLNRPGLTAEKFLPDPFSAIAGSRMYRTGDTVYLRGDGELEYVGRVDRQVKIRGFRVELGEIELALCRCGSVFECAVETTTSPAGWTTLTAWVVPSRGEKLEAAKLRAFLSERLPDYMVPSSFVLVGNLPLTPNGKVDRKALLQLLERGPAQTVVPPRNETELKILEVWEEVMQISPISVTENFFSLGGNSMLGVRIISRLEQVLNKELSLALLFEHKSIEELAVAVGRHLLPGNAPSLVRIQSGSSRPPLFLVHPMGGGVFGYVHLARHLGNDQPVYGLQSAGLHSGSPSRSVEEMAAQYIDAITEVDPSGPYRLGGWSMGGVVAFEMARQLVTRGRDAALLALIDSRPRPAPAASSHRSAQDPLLDEIVDQFRRAFGERFQWDDRQSQINRDQQIPLLLEQMKRLHLVAADTGEAELGNILAVQAAHAEALAAYVPREYPGKLVLFRSACIDSVGPGPESDPSLGWQEYSPVPVEIYSSPGSHDEMILEPNVSELAGQLKSLLISCQDLA